MVLSRFQIEALKGSKTGTIGGIPIVGHGTRFSPTELIPLLKTAQIVSPKGIVTTGNLGFKLGQIITPQKIVLGNPKPLATGGPALPNIPPPNPPLIPSLVETFGGIQKQFESLSPLQQAAVVGGTAVGVGALGAIASNVLSGGKPGRKGKKRKRKVRKAKRGGRRVTRRRRVRRSVRRSSRRSKAGRVSFTTRSGRRVNFGVRRKARRTSRVKRRRR